MGCPSFVGLDNLSTKMDDAYATIHQQQIFLEHVDGREKGNYFIITGVNENYDGCGI